MLLRTAKESDLFLLLAAENACFSHPFTEKAILSHLTESWGYALLAEENGVLCGYLLGSLIAGEGEIFRVAVLPAHRRRGIGEGLVSAFLALCED